MPKRFTSQGFGFSLDYPDSWVLTETPGVAVQFSKREPTEQDPFAPSVNVIIQNVEEDGMTLDKFTELSINQMKSMLPDLRGLEVEPVTIDGREGKCAVYSTQLGPNEMKFYQTWTMEGRIAYVITYSAEEHEHNENLDQVETIMNTFTIDNEPTEFSRVPEELANPNPYGDAHIVMSSFFDKKNKFELFYPQTWTCSTSKKHTIVDFHYQVNLPEGGSAVLGGSISAEKLKDNEQEYQKKLDYEFSKVTLRIPKFRSFKTDYLQWYFSSYDIPSLAPVKGSEIYHYWTKANGHVYHVTLFTNSSENVAKVFEKMISSFRFSNRKEYGLRYENLASKIGLDYPEDFDITEGPMNSILFLPHGADGSKFTTNINLLVKPSDGITLQMFADQMKQQMSNEGTIEEWAEGPAKKLSFSAEVQPGLKVTCEQFIAVRGEVGAVVVFVAESDIFEEEYEYWEQYLQSFEFVK